MKVEDQQYDDCRMLADALSNEKYLTVRYNDCVNECTSVKLRDEMMNLLAEEHQIAAEFFSEMSKRGWYPTKQAEPNQISQVKQKFADVLTKL